MKYLFVIFSFSFLISSALSQRIDSLKYELLNHRVEDEVKVEILNNLGFEYWIIDPVQSIIYGQQAKVLAEILHDSSGLAFANRVIGVAHWARGSYDHGLRFLLDGLAIYEQERDSLGWGNCLMNIGLIYADRKDNEVATKYYFEALKMFEAINADHRKATTYTKLATVFIDEGKLEAAYDFLDRAGTIHVKAKFLYGQAEILNRYGMLYSKTGSYDSAIYYFEKSIALGKKINDIDGIAKSHSELADVYLKQGDIEKAEDILVRGLEYARKTNSHKWLKEIYKGLHLTAREKGNLSRSIDYYDRYIQEKDSILNEQTLNNITRLETELAITEQKRQLEAKEGEIIILEQEAEIQKTRFIILVILVIAIVIVGILIVRNRQLAAQRKAEKAEKEADRIKHELEFKNRELVSYTVNFLQKNQLFEELTELITDLKKRSPNDMRKDLIAMERTVNKHLQVDKDWEDFKLRFENLHTGFFDSLLEHQPSLTGNDLKLCALIKMNFSIKETADMMGISTESVKTARYRLKKKLELPTETTVNDFLNSLG
ncbi:MULTISPECIES: tetratricopeptide repeat protein [unclassified Ekhidna]|jgi:tetratricopeptide (TPR) repeat protein|uniref:tetratricopeptide repeat protein n=1 Tax=unclassified Ekhidna TaxID=2632188 RepID=UPI0032DF06BE